MADNDTEASERSTQTNNDQDVSAAANDALVVRIHVPIYHPEYPRAHAVEEPASAMEAAEHAAAAAAAADPTLQDVEGDSVESGEGEEAMSFDTTNDPALAGLKEISSQASWTVSTHKPTCGPDALRAPNPYTFWQSDGPQPHMLTIHFNKLQKIVRLRVYLDFVLDESYTPTKIEFYGGYSPSTGMVQFAEWKGEEPRGWQEISLEGVGVGGRAELRAMALQVKVCENHQNGKDTHVRGVQIFVVDEAVKGKSMEGADWDVGRVVGEGEEGRKKREFDREFVGEQPDWMGEPEVR